MTVIRVYVLISTQHLLFAQCEDSTAAALCEQLLAAGDTAFEGTLAQRCAAHCVQVRTCALAMHRGPAAAYIARRGAAFALLR